MMKTALDKFTANIEEGVFMGLVG